MKDTEYKTMALHIAGHCINETRFEYNGVFMFDGFSIEVSVQYRAGRRYWMLSSDKFKVISWRIYPEGDSKVIFDPQRLLRYLN